MMQEGYEASGNVYGMYDICEACGLGTYNSLPNQACGTCADDRTTLRAGASSESACVCKQGYANNYTDGDVCVECVAGAPYPRLPALHISIITPITMWNTISMQALVHIARLSILILHTNMHMYGHAYRMYALTCMYVYSCTIKRCHRFGNKRMSGALHCTNRSA